MSRKNKEAFSVFCYDTLQDTLGFMYANCDLEAPEELKVIAIFEALRTDNPEHRNYMPLDREKRSGVEMRSHDYTDLQEAILYIAKWENSGVNDDIGAYLDYCSKRRQILADWEEKEQLEKDEAEMPIKKAEVIVSDFLNGPFINSLIVTKGGIVKKKGVSGDTWNPQTYGCLSGTTVKALLVNGLPYEYMLRLEALTTWLADELVNYNAYLTGASKRSSRKPKVPDALDAILEGLVPRNTAGTSESAWAFGTPCEGSFSGETIPGLVLRVDPVKFEEFETRYIAKKIVQTEERAKETLRVKRRIHPRVLNYGNNISVKLRKGKYQKAHQESPYDLDLLNIQPSATALVDSMKRILAKPEDQQPRCISGLFHGVPGTGKTALVNYLGEELEMPVVKRTYAELQSMYVGEGEKQLKEAFGELRGSNSIFLIDELDSVASSRHNADRQHQKTFTNQLLTELDEFDGVFIATTNLMEDLDPAVLRRLFLKVEFDFLTEEQVEKCFQLYFPQFRRSQLGIYDYATPGDFKAVQNASLFEPGKLKVSRVREMFQAEIDLKLSTLPDAAVKETKRNLQF